MLRSPSSGIDPLEAFVAAVVRVECRVLAVHFQQVTKEGLQMLMPLICQQEPVDLAFLAPLAELSEILSHEQKFFARDART